jgi:hypothetical protein
VAPEQNEVTDEFALDFKEEVLDFWVNLDLRDLDLWEVNVSTILRGLHFLWSRLTVTLGRSYKDVPTWGDSRAGFVLLCRDWGLA